MHYPLERLILGSFFKLYIRSIEGKDKFPRPPFIVACNHSSYADDFLLPMVLLSAVRARLHIFVNSRFYKNLFIRSYLNYYDMIPVDVAKDVSDGSRRKKTNEKAMSMAVDYLRKGDIIALFPEGGRSDDGSLKKAKHGVARLALEAKVPIIPIAIKGSYELLPKGKKIPRFKRVEIKIGEPIDISAYKTKDYKTYEGIASLVMKNIASLMGQEYRY